MKELLAATIMLTLRSPALAADDPVQVSRAGTRTAATAPAQNFTGAVKVEMLHSPAGAQRASAGSVSFAPGARTAWHSHPLGQALIVTAGVGRVQRWAALLRKSAPATWCASRLASSTGTAPRRAAR